MTVIMTLWRSSDDGERRMTVLMMLSILHLIKDETFPKHYHHHHLPGDNCRDMTPMTLFSSANYWPHLVTLLYDVSMSLIAS